MIPTSPELENLLLHLAGREHLRYVLDRGYRLDMAAGIRSAQPEDFLASFGKKEFYAAVGFIDMHGFTDKSRGKSPSEVRSLVAPFLDAVIRAATIKQCFVDKTIGDEVMLVMPCGFGDGEPLSDLTWLVTDILARLRAAALETGFSAGFAFGMVLLDEIKAGNYSEWTVYGNCVSGAKRLQMLPHQAPAATEDPTYKLVIGAVDSEQHSFNEHLAAWLEQNGSHSPIEFLHPRFDCESLKGVGKMCFMASYLQRRQR
jgi:class 3 adenylate cyclase